MWVEQTKLQICQSQTKLDIDWKCYHYTGKWMAFLESKDTKLKTKLKTVVWYQGRKKLMPKHKLPNCPTLTNIENDDFTFTEYEKQ